MSDRTEVKESTESKSLISTLTSSITHPIQTLVNVAEGAIDLLQGNILKDAPAGSEFVRTEGDVAPVPLQPYSKIVERKVTYEERIKEIQDLSERHKIEREKAEEECKIHQDLLAEAQALELDAARLAAEAENRERELEHSVLRQQKAEQKYELKRASAHAHAVQGENERAKAAAEAMMFEKEHEYAKMLEEKHRIGQLRAEALKKRHEMQQKELLLAEERLRFENNNAAILSAEISGPSSLEIEVGVRPRYIPEKHKESKIIPEAALATTVVSENYEMPKEEEIKDVFEKTVQITAKEEVKETTIDAAGAAPRQISAKGKERETAPEISRAQV